MIPEVVKDCLNLLVSAVVTSRNADLQPSTTRVFGIRFHANNITVTFCIPEAGSEQIIKNFEDNGRVALTISTFESNDSYQLKGKFVSWKRNTEQDDQRVDQYRSGVLEMAIGQGYPEEFVTAASVFKCKPGITVTFDVESVFGQAPHPETGKLIS